MCIHIFSNNNMAITKAVLQVSPGASVIGGTVVTLDGTLSTAKDNTTLSGPDAFLFIDGYIIYAII